MDSRDEYPVSLSCSVSHNCSKMHFDALFSRTEVSGLHGRQSAMAEYILNPKEPRIFLRMVPLVEFMYLVFTCMPGESYRR